MTDTANEARIRLAPGYRLQFEPVQNQSVLLYPEGMVELSETAADVLALCNGERSVESIVAALEEAYDGLSLAGDVQEFLEGAHARGWIVHA